ncbi:MAG: type II 3-dehydroquinate dehydratase [Gemmatimonadaceae bacterium]|nr:type II 3-dehydroquinate dehydratase [Gemmatimonadaceae bacterium]
MSRTVAVLHGPSLNLLGRREPAIYGTTTLAEIDQRLASLGDTLGVRVECAQRNGEGELIDVVHGWAGRVTGALVNAGAYTHTSLALRDALVAVQVPFVEVHLTNVHAREAERRRSMLAPAAVGVVCGFGAASYEHALRALVGHLSPT